MSILIILCKNFIKKETFRLKNFLSKLIKNMYNKINIQKKTSIKQLYKIFIFFKNFVKSVKIFTMMINYYFVIFAMTVIIRFVWYY